MCGHGLVRWYTVVVRHFGTLAYCVCADCGEVGNEIWARDPQVARWEWT